MTSIWKAWNLPWTNNEISNSQHLGIKSNNTWKKHGLLLDSYSHCHVIITHVTERIRLWPELSRDKKGNFKIST